MIDNIETANERDVLQLIERLKNYFSNSEKDDWVIGDAVEKIDGGYNIVGSQTSEMAGQLFSLGFSKYLRPDFDYLQYLMDNEVSHCEKLSNLSDKSIKALLFSWCRSEQFSPGAHASILVSAPILEMLNRCESIVKQATQFDYTYLSSQKEEMVQTEIESLLGITQQNLSEFKLHMVCPSNAEGNPLDEFRIGIERFNEWQSFQNQKNFNCKYVISFIQLPIKFTWAFAGVYYNSGIDESYKGKGKSEYMYRLSLSPFGKEYIGRLIIRFNKSFRNCYIKSTWIKEFEIYEVKSPDYSIQSVPWPRFEGVCEKWSVLKSIIQKKQADWLAPLSSVNGVYVITDTKNGKLYIGSAIGNESIWGRWKEYIQTYTGNNNGLIELFKDVDNKEERASFLQFSILQYFPKSSQDSDVLEREQFWKKALDTKVHGYNKN